MNYDYNLSVDIFIKRYNYVLKYYNARHLIVEMNRTSGSTIFESSHKKPAENVLVRYYQLVIIESDDGTREM